MKTTTIKFPIEKSKSHWNLEEPVRDFISSEIVDGDLCLNAQQYLALEIMDFDFQETYVVDGEMYYIYDVIVMADDQSIDIIDEWQKQFKVELN